MKWNQKGLDRVNGAPEWDLVVDAPWVEARFCDDDVIWTVFVKGVGRLTVVDRMTGYGYRDVETGYCDLEGKFWLASGNQDVREHPDLTALEAISWVKEHANNCKGD